MTKDGLLIAQTLYYNKVEEWFIGELAKWSKKHNMYVEDYTILRMWVIGSDDSHEPYSHHRDTDLDTQFENALKDYEVIFDGLIELGITTWQGLAYREDAKFIH